MRFPTCARQAGLSLVELMVGMLVGLIGIIIISHLYITNEQYKRSTTGSGAAQVNGAVALYSIERDLRMAGYGINHTSALGCGCNTAADANCSPLQYYFNGTPQSPPAAPVLRTLIIAPVVIVSPPNQPGSITVLYGGDNERSVPISLSQNMVAPNFNYDTTTATTAGGTAGFQTDDLIVVTQPGGAGGDTCALAQITVNPVPNSLLTRTAGTYNPPFQNGTLPVFSRGAMVFNLGIAPGAPGTPGIPRTPPVWRTFSIENNRLVATEVLPPQGSARLELVDDIVDLQALYGKDTDNDVNRTVDVYDNVTPTTAALWQQVLAVRIAVLARSQNYEQPTAAGVCQATTAANQPVWGRTAAVPAGIPFPVLAAPGALPSCYKYRVFETIVPLRNMIWR